MKKKLWWLVKIIGAVLAGVCVALMLESNTPAGGFMEAVLYYGILFLAYRYGAGTGAVAGTVCGIIFAVLYNDVAALGILCLIGTLAGTFRKIGRFASSLAFITGACGAGIIYAHGTFDDLIMGMLLSVCAFLLTPKMFFETGQAKAAENPPAGKELIFTEKLQSMSRTMGDVVGYISSAGSGAAITPATTAAVMCTISNIVCDECSECRMGCKSMEFDSTIINNISRIYEDNGKVTDADIDNFFDSRCVNKSIYINELNAGLGSVVERKEWEHHVSESRNTVASGYREMEDLLEKLAEDFDNVKDFTKDVKEDIFESIGRGMIIRELLAVEGPCGREIYMTAATRGRECETSRGIAAKVGRALDCVFVPSNDSPMIIGKKPVKLKLVEDNDYLVLFGVARERKKGESISGDSFSQMSLDGQKILLGLSDGMGSGKDAAKHSRIAIGMAEKLLENGFSPEQVSRTVNSVLLLQEDGEPTTVDLAVLDLKNSQMKLVKMGAVPTFIKRKNETKVLKASSLPAGIVNDCCSQTIDFDICDGDIIVMMTDGVLDAIADENKEDAMKEIIMGMDTESPKDIAENIISLVKPADGAIDDMTVIAAGVWSR